MAIRRVFPVTILFYILILLCALPVSSQNVRTWETGQRDLLGEALDVVGFTRDDLGYEPAGYWTRYPRAPYKLPIFDALFAEPMRIYDYTIGMGGVLEAVLDPERTSQHRGDQAITNNSIHKAFVLTAVEARVDGFRSYSTNLLPRADEEEPILNAIRRVYINAGDQLLRSSFGAEPAWPNPESEIIDQLEGIDPAFQLILAEAILNGLDAVMWRNAAIRNIPVDIQNKIFAMRDFAQTQGDGIVYFPEVDDAAQLIDEQAMAYAAMKMAQGVEDTRYLLDTYISENPDYREFSFEADTPYGRIVVSGYGDDTHAGSDYFLLIDLGGDDHYTGPVGATTSPEHGVAMCLDLDGDDVYDYYGDTPSQGAGVLGCGILYDARGDDRYIAKDVAQGAGILGTGFLFDGDGEDEYRMEETGQGSGSFGHGMAMDSGEGDDWYYMYGEGQGFGGCNGIGILANWSGNEHYVAEPYSSVVYRGDYHSDFELNVSNCQGVGSGRRGDGTDGHSWAGGLGLIADMHGNDTYEAGNFSIGCGYWFGIGLVYEKEGNDFYYSPVYTQASGAHYCIGAIIDEAGNDVHDTWDHSTSAISFARDWTISLLVDKSGNDYYRAWNTSLCYVNIRSNAFFFDLSGNDHYVVGDRQRMLGACDFYHYDTPSPLSPFASYCNSVSVFIDSGGEDVYESWTRTAIEDGEDSQSSRFSGPEYNGTRYTDSVEESTRYGNNLMWQSPEPESDNYGYNNYGIGWDLEAGDDGVVIDVTWLDREEVEE